MKDLKEDFIVLINKLPIKDTVKQELLSKLDKAGIDAVKEDIKTILTIAAGKLSEQDLDALKTKAQKELEAELQQIETEAKQLADAVAKNQDQEKLAAVRQQINQ